MPSLRLKGPSCVALALLITQMTLSAVAQKTLKPHGVSAQFGFAAAKLLQQFHLPGSPDQLLGFLVEYTLRQKMGNTLPLKLDANSAFPSLESSALPGGPFTPKTFTLTVVNLRSPLAPGDYVLPVMAYCTQYSIHRPGRGTAYKLAPVEGTQAATISTLLWRGTLSGTSPRDLQAVSWAIQSGLTYASLPKPYQDTVDQLIPDYKDKLKGNPMDVIQSTYTEVTGDPRKYLQTYIKDRYNKTVPLMILPKLSVPAPPLEAMLGKMGPSGLLILDAKKQSNIFLTQYTTKEKGEQILFSGQGEALPPQPALGAWTVRVPNTAYVRFTVKGGNMQNDNLLEIRILGQPGNTSELQGARLVQASYSTSSPAAVPPTSVLGLLGVNTLTESTEPGSITSLNANGVIGYPQGTGAQALMPVAFVPPPPPPPPPPTVVITKLTYNPVSFPTKKSAHALALGIYLGATFSDPSAGKAYRWVQRISTNKPAEGCPASTSSDFDPANSFYDGGPCPPAFTFYRPAADDPSWRNYLQYNYVFRDIPDRNGSDRNVTFNAELTLEHANNGDNQPTEPPLVKIDWGFTIDGKGILRSKPIVVAGARFVDGDPNIREVNKIHMCDANWIALHSVPLNVAVDEKLLMNHKLSTRYTFLPEGQALP
jgi:hypothetical protein